MTGSGPRVVVTSAYFEPGYKAGGPIPSVKQIVSSAEGIRILLLTNDRDLGDTAPYPGLSGRTVTRGDLDILYLDRRRPGHWWRAIKTIRGGPVDLLYVNSLWDPWFTILPLLLSVLRVVPARRVLVAPRGELSAGALSIKARKKKVVKPVLRALLGVLRPSWHASSAMDEADIRRAFGADRRVFVVSESSPHVPSTAPLEPRPGPVRLVFVSRIVPMKNLLTVLAALGHVRGPAALDVYGPVEDGEYWRRCQEAIAALPPGVTVEYRGVVTPAEVADTFARYDAFVLPTLGENFGHVIAESLSVGCPVICSDRTPWSACLAAGGGEVLPDLTPPAVAAVLDRWLALSVDERVGRRRQARDAYASWLAEQSGPGVLALALTTPAAR
ncbi:Glycosyltransferase involved in cell wall bisynthesis [Jatrophihabitans endophyticus]|uniref:Glycosyltransferase involved in cell wall bisynthesis n=1 Tax=Jatrophihabitans endophyticus TaxID=1206085 RepID=A0A1M5IN73_9ACTN|nr:glycosyltransferase family 4 protein [Jatrophihabitans endophyticus]SHG29685.1 Glycosyltransferase involved in cell wall bisynthesis [Jatrophihabitans endophyticus]